MGQASGVTSALDAIPLRRFDLGNGRGLWNSASAGRETEFIANEIFRDRCYEQHGIAVRDGDVVVDAGANIGAFTLSLMDRRKGLTIVAVEPSPVTRTCLERNLADVPGRQQNEVRILPIALGARPDTLTLTYFPDAPGNSTLRPDDKEREVDRLINNSTPAQAGTLHRLLAYLPKPWVAIALRMHFRPLFQRRIETTCEVRPLSAVIREQGIARIDLLKIDVEGFELQVLEGIDDADWAKIRQLVMEISPANKPALPELRERLRGLGFANVIVESPGKTEPTPDNPLGCLVFALRAEADPELTLRYATATDIAGLAAFSAATYAAAFGAHFKPGDLAAHLAATLAPESWRKYLAHDRVLLAEDGTRLVGYLQFGPHEPDGVFFHRLYVATDRLGQGIGSRLLRAALDAPEVRAAPEVLIDVWEHNTGARRLYERFGFVATGQRMPDFVTASGEVSPGDLIMVRRQVG